MPSYSPGLPSGGAGSWPTPPTRGRVLDQQMPASSTSASLPAFLRPSSEGLSCPAGWFMEGGASPSPPPRARGLQAQADSASPPPPSPWPNLPGVLPPCIYNEPADIGDRCFVNIRSDQPCGTAEDVGRICLTIDRKFHFAFIAGACLHPLQPSALGRGTRREGHTPTGTPAARLHPLPPRPNRQVL